MKYEKLLAGTGICLLAMGSVHLAAQQSSTAGFADEVLAALGGNGGDTIEISASGWDACLGQAWLVTDGWARWELTDYRRVFDYESGATRHTANRRAGMDPGRIGGCGAQPDASPAPQQSYADSSSAWMDQLLIWLTPHGFLEKLETGNPEISAEDDGWLVSTPVVSGGITYMLEGNFNRDHELVSARTWADDPVYGDMEVKAEYGAYRDWGDVAWPESLSLHQGGLVQLHLDMENVVAGNERLTPPEPRAGFPPRSSDMPLYTDVGNGVYVLNGQYQGVVVEFDSFTVVLDGLQSDARTAEIRDFISEYLPGKPVRYVLSTHSHFDHASGLRQFAADGATILTHQDNVAFFGKALSAPRTLRNAATEPDRVSPVIQGVEGRFVISDDSGKTVEILELGPSPHAADMLIAWLPETGTIVEADILQPWINPIFGGENGPHPMLVYLAEELETLGLPYRNFIPIHVPPEPPMMTRADLEAVLTGSGE